MRLRSLCNLSVWATVMLACGSAYAAEPGTPECIDAHERALELRNRSQLRASRDQWLLCAAASCPEEIRNECARGVLDINAAMPTIVFEARDPSERDLSDVAVTIDGQPLLARLDGTAMAVDPGEHDFEFRSQAFPPVHKRLLVRENEKGRREKVHLGEPAPPPPVTTYSISTAPAGPRLDPPRDEAAHSYTAQRVIGISLGVGGLACLGVAVADQIIAKNRESDSRSAAASPDPAVQETSRPLHDQAKQAQTYAIVFGTTGVLALGAGLYLLLSSLGDHGQPQSAGPIRRLVPSVQRGSIALNFIQTY
jgi:hypothetical protein